MFRFAAFAALLSLCACDPEVSSNRGESAMSLQDSATNPPTGDASTGGSDASTAQRARVSGVETTLNLRSGPSTDDTILTSIPLGCLVTLLGETNGDWVRVDYRGTAGWAFSQYLTNVPAGTADCSQ